MVALQTRKGSQFLGTLHGTWNSSSRLLVPCSAVSTVCARLGPSELEISYMPGWAHYRLNILAGRPGQAESERLMIQGSCQIPWARFSRNFKYCLKLLIIIINIFLKKFFCMFFRARGFKLLLTLYTLSLFILNIVSINIIFSLRNNEINHRAKNYMKFYFITFIWSRKMLILTCKF